MKSKPWSLTTVALIFAVSLGLGFGAAVVEAGRGSILYQDSDTGRSFPQQIAACYQATRDAGTVNSCTSAPPTAVGQVFRITVPGVNAEGRYETLPAWVYDAGSGSAAPNTGAGVLHPAGSIALYYQTLHAVDGGFGISLWYSTGDCNTCWTELGNGGSGGGSQSIELTSPLGTITIGSGGGLTTIDVVELANATPDYVLTGITVIQTGISTGTATASHTVTVSANTTATGTATETITSTGTVTANTTQTMTTSATETQISTATHTATETTTYTLTSSSSTTGTDTHTVTSTVTGTATNTNGTMTVTSTSTGTTTATSLVTGESYPFGIAVDGTYIYWTMYNGGAIRRSTLAGESVTSLVTGESGPSGIAVDGTYIYWTAYDGGAIRRSTLAGGSVTSLVTGESYPRGIAVDGTYI